MRPIGRGLMPFQAVAGGRVPARKKVHARSNREILARFGKDVAPQERDGSNSKLHRIFERNSNGATICFNGKTKKQV